MKKKERDPDLVPGIGSNSVAIAVYIATGDRELARAASKRFSVDLGRRTFDSLTFTELFDWLDENTKED